MPASSIMKLCVCGALGAGTATGAYVAGKSEGVRAERSQGPGKAARRAKRAAAAAAVEVPCIPALDTAALVGPAAPPVTISGFGPVALGGFPGAAVEAGEGGGGSGPLKVPEPVAIGLFGLAAAGVFARFGALAGLRRV